MVLPGVLVSVAMCMVTLSLTVIQSPTLRGGLGGAAVVLSCWAIYESLRAWKKGRCQ